MKQIKHHNISVIIRMHDMNRSTIYHQDMVFSQGLYPCNRINGLIKYIKIIIVFIRRQYFLFKLTFILTKEGLVFTRYHGFVSKNRLYRQVLYLQRPCLIIAITKEKCSHGIVNLSCFLFQLIKHTMEKKYDKKKTVLKIDKYCWFFKKLFYFYD